MQDDDIDDFADTSTEPIAFGEHSIVKKKYVRHLLFVKQTRHKLNFIAQFSRKRENISIYIPKRLMSIDPRYAKVTITIEWEE